MLKKVKIFLSSLLAVLMLCQVGVMSVGAKDDLGTLAYYASQEKNTAVGWDYTSRKYKREEGSYYKYKDLVSTVSNKETPNTLLNINFYNQLTKGAKTDFLTDYFNAGRMTTDYCIKHDFQEGVTEETMQMWTEMLQYEVGEGSQLLTMLLAQTKPDFASASRIYEPFSGVVGTVLGLGSIIIMSLLVVTMLLDISFISIPAVQVMFGDDSGNSGIHSKLISKAARRAVQQDGGDKGTKEELVAYLKGSFVKLLALGVCLLYLVSGNIFSLIGWMIDLFQGFVGL